MHLGAFCIENAPGCILYRECTHPLSCNYYDRSSCNWIVSSCNRFTSTCNRVSPSCNQVTSVAIGSVRVATSSYPVAIDTGLRCN